VHLLEPLDEELDPLTPDIGIDDEMRAAVFAPLSATAGGAAECGEGGRSEEKDQRGRDSH